MIVQRRMSAWPSTRAGRVLDALLRIGWTITRHSGSHRTLSRAGERKRYLVLTSGMTSHDGIAEVSRLIVRAVQDAPVSVLSLVDPPRAIRSATGYAGVGFWGAGGQRLRFLAAALRAATSRADVICVHLGLSPAAWLATTGRARLTVFLHGIEAWKSLGAMQGWALDRADIFVANSEHTARRFREANPTFSSKPIQVCHLGVGIVPHAREEAASGGGSSFALIVGRMAGAERYKGHDLLLDIWPSVAAEVPAARLVVVGDGDDRARLQTKAAVLGERVSFLGHVSDSALEVLYRDCAFFVMPSRDEGFGLVFLEAMRAGKACVGGVGAAAEVIEDGVTGLVVDPAEPDAVLKAVLRLFREPETRERMGRAGVERVARHFTEAHFRRRFRAVLGLPPEAA